MLRNLVQKVSSLVSSVADFREGVRVPELLASDIWLVVNTRPHTLENTKVSISNLLLSHGIQSDNLEYFQELIIIYLGQDS